MKRISPLTGKILYGGVFTVILPAGLILWASRAERGIMLPPFSSLPLGVVLSVLGLAVMASALRVLWQKGGGLPMSPYPPERFVSSGIYRIIAHPMYTGFSLLCFGVSFLTGSRAGLWLVSPAVVLFSMMFVAGHERERLIERFGEDLPRPFLRLPAASKERPAVHDRVSVFLLVFLPWLMIYEAVRFIGPPPDALNGYLPFEKILPVWQWAEALYISVYPFVLLVPLVAGTSGDLRRFALRGLLSTGLVTLLFLTVPLVAPPRPFTTEGIFGAMLAFERQLDTPYCAFPSFHVIWAFLAASVYVRRQPRLGIVWWGWAVLVSLSCILTGMHAAVDVAGGILIVLLVSNLDHLWEFIRRATEAVANSWKEFTIGPVRIMTHGAYAAVGMIAGVIILGVLTGPAMLPFIVLLGVCSVIGAGIWAQIIEGSPVLLRPYGYYGSLFASILACLVLSLAGYDGWLLMAAFAVGAPWVQAIGRLRCLVQGCCHGRPSPIFVGIRYMHPRSRVTRLSDLGGVPLHPTPLYSILSNVVIGVLLMRLWELHAEESMIAGSYLILSGLCRFVEESYRGEPQTPVIGGLRFYQWVAMEAILLGALFTSIQTPPVLISPQYSSTTTVVALILGLVAWFAFGIDFPRSNTRFSRLV